MMFYQTRKKGSQRRSQIKDLTFAPNPREFGRPKLIFEDGEKFIIIHFESWKDIRALLSQAGQLSHDFDKERNRVHSN